MVYHENLVTISCFCTFLIFIQSYFFTCKYRYVCGPKNFLNHTLAIDSPFQTGLYHCTLQKHFPRRVNQTISYIMRTLLFSKLELASEIGALPSRRHLQTRLCFRRGSPLACGVMGIACGVMGIACSS